MSTTTTSDTAAIDDKKDTTPTTSPLSGVFAATMFSKLLLLGIIVVTGTCMVYTCRVAQSNILPTDINLFPYTDIFPTINNGTDMPINIDIVKTSDGIYSTQIKFPLTENMDGFKKGIFGYLKGMIDSKDAGNFQLYVATTIQQVLATNLAIVNWIFNLFNSSLTESMIIFFVPFIVLFINFFTSIVNTFYLMFLWFYNLPLLFATKSNSNGGKTTWSPGIMWSWIDWWLNTKSIFWIFIFVLLFFILGIGLIIPILAGLITLYSIFLPLFMRAEKVNNSTYTFIDALYNVIEYKLSVIMYIVSYFVISDAYSSYGSYSALVAIIACLLLYFFTDIYKQFIPENKTLWTNNYNQAEKTSGNGNPTDEEFNNVRSLASAPPAPVPIEQPPKSQSIASSEIQEPVPESQQEPALESQQTSTQPPLGGEIELRNLNPPLEQDQPIKRLTQLGPSDEIQQGITQKPGEEVGNNQLGGRIKKRHNSRKNVKL
jgi:hypothetical protein